MNLALLGRLLSVILAAVAGAQVFCALVGIWFWWEGDAREVRAVAGLGGAAALAAMLALAGAWIGREAEPRLLRKEAFALIGISWIAASVLGAIPFWVALPWASLADGLFESASGFTTTGGSVFGDLSLFPNSLLAWRSMMQWIGGLGVVVFFVAILSSLGAGSKVLFSNEASTGASELDVSRVQSGVRRILLLYLLLSAGCLIGYRVAGLGWFDAWCHMATTVCTGGFSNQSAGIGAFESAAVEWVAIVFMILGGTSFPFVFRLVRRERGILGRSDEVLAYWAILAVATLLVLWTLWLGPVYEGGWSRMIRDSAFQVVSIMTTTGYSTADYNLWLPEGQVILILLMLVGGCSGSTSGGLKVGRVLVGFKVFARQIELAIRPNLVRPIKLNGRVLPEDAAVQSSIFLMMMGIVMAVGVILVAMAEATLSFTGTVSAVFACLFNIGPGLAEVGPAANFGHLHSASKVFLSLLMIMGRVELLAILVLLAPSLWRKFS